MERIRERMECTRKRVRIHQDRDNQDRAGHGGIHKDADNQDRAEKNTPRTCAFRAG